MKNILPWNQSFFSELNSILSNTLNQFNQGSEIESNHCQLYATPQGWASRVDLPGYEKDELTLNFSDDALRLTAENETRGRRSLRFALGDEVEVKDISAKLEHGVLEISLPKKAELLPRTHSINIQ